MKPNKISIQVINECELEDNPRIQRSPAVLTSKVNPSPLLAYTIAQVLESFATPFKQYPLPASPLKTITPKPSQNSSLAKSPSLSVTCSKPGLLENDIFAISPGMFPRKTRHMDFLDILEDAERKDFESPIKLAIPPTPVEQHPSPPPVPEGQDHQMAVDVEEEAQDGVDAEICHHPADEKGTVFQQQITEFEVLENIPDDEEHPHFALLAYLADLASVRDPAPEDLQAVGEEVPHGSIEDILTAAALAESFQDEIFPTEHDQATAVEFEEEDVEVDIMTIVEDTEQEWTELTTESASAGENQETTHRTLLELGASIDAESVEECALVNHVDNEPAIDEPTEAEDHDTDSLVSYSEAEVTVEVSVHEEIEGFQVPLGHSVNHANENVMQEDCNEVAPSTDTLTPADTVGIDETGQFTSGAIAFFEDKAIPDNIPNPRHSLDHSVIFSFAAEQIVVPSPPKRLIPASHEDIVNYSILCSINNDLVC